MKIILPFDSQILIDTNDEFLHKFENANESEKDALCYRPLEIIEIVSNKLISSGCSEERLVDVLVCIGISFLTKDKKGISDAIKDAPTIKPSLKIGDGKEMDIQIYGPYFFDYDFVQQFKSAQELIQSDCNKDFHIYHKLIFIGWGIYFAGLHFGKIKEEECRYIKFFYFLINVALKESDSKSSFFRIIKRDRYCLYRILIKNLIFSFLETCDNLKISDLNINNTIKEINDEDLSLMNIYEIGDKELYKLLKGKSCKRERIAVFEKLDGIDSAQLEKFYVSGSEEEFLKNLKKSPDYRKANIGFSCFFRVKRCIGIFLKYQKSHPTNYLKTFLKLILPAQLLDYNLKSNLGISDLMTGDYSKFIDSEADKQSLEMFFQSYTYLPLLFKSNIIDQLDMIIDASPIRDLIRDQINKQVQAEEKPKRSNYNGENEDFNIPIDFCKMKKERNGEYFTDPLFKFKDDNSIDTFKNFINYIADKGYIEDSPDEKRLLVYRLTGRWKPDGEIHRIKWKNDDKGLVLSYIVRYGYSKSRTKYQLMKKIFDGPVWGENADISKNADGAKTEVRKYLHHLYPNIFKLKPS